MSIADLFTADFPHGAPAGFDLGCKSQAGCPNAGDPDWLTCREAKELHRSDYSYRTHPKEQPMARQRGPQTVPDNFPMEKHGTPAGYKKGCRLGDTCPGIQTTGKSCTTAASDQVTERHRVARAREASGLTKPASPKPTPVAPLKVDPISPEAAEALAETIVSPPLAEHLPVDAPGVVARELQDRIDDLTAALERSNTLLEQEREASALATKRADELLAERIRRHEADARDLEDVRSQLAAEVAAHNETRDQLDQAQLDHVKQALAAPDPVHTGGGGDPDRRDRRRHPRRTPHRPHRSLPRRPRRTPPADRPVTP